MLVTAVKNWLGRFYRACRKQIWGSLLLAVTLFLSAPLSVFLVNRKTLEFTLWDALPVYLGYSLLAFVGLATAAVALKHGCGQYVPVLYVALSLGLVVQGNFLLYDLGKLDGHTIEWSAYYTTATFPVEVVLWLVLVVGAVVLRKPLYRNLGFAVGLVLLLGLGPSLGQLVGQGLTAGQGSGAKQYFDYSKQFEFSDQQNVVVIVLDTFRSDAFEELLHTDPQYAEAFKDFTSFTNAAAGYPTTKPSLPLILTGKYYDNQIPMEDFIADIQENSLPKLLADNQLEVEGYFFIAPFPAPWDNLVQRMPAYRLKSEVNKQLFVAFMRYVPLPVKPFFADQYYRGEEYLHKDLLDFYNGSASASIVSSPSKFKFIHLTGPHPPFQLDSSFNRVDRGYLEQARASLNAVVKLLGEMKESGVYDNSLILIIGDHGTDIPLPLSYAGRPDLVDTDLIMPSRLLSFAEPLVLGKSFHQRNDQMIESDAPVSLQDIPKTVADALSLENNFDGYSIFEDIPEDRIRRFFYYKWRRLSWNKDFLPPMYEYEIKGNISDITSWKFLNKMYSEDGITEIAYPFYESGTNLISIINTGETDLLFGPGFEKFVEPGSPLWATGPQSCIYFQYGVSEKALEMTIQGYPLLSPGKLDRQRMIISIDQEEIANVDAGPNMSFTIPAEAAARFTADGKAQLCFEFPDARSPKELGESGDSRLLGYRFTSLIITEHQPLALPFEAQLNKGQDLAAVALTGFSSPEEGFTWTNGKLASIQLPAPETPTDLVFEFAARPFLVKDHLEYQRVTLRSNGQVLDQLELRERGEVSVEIPAAVLADELVIELELPDAASPQSYGLSGDLRELGLAFEWIRVRKK